MSTHQLPLLHYQHLQRLARLRRCSLPEALQFLMARVAPSDRDELTEHFGATSGTRQVDLGSHDRDMIIARIQGLPRNIRPVTDGPYLETFEFLEDDGDTIGIAADGVRVYDYRRAAARDEQVFALVEDLLPQMTIEQYRLYNTFNAQYLRLVREPHLFTMPRRPGIGIDAGCYVGYKALALAKFMGRNPVLAFELSESIFDLLVHNLSLNPQFDIRPYNCALSDKSETLTAFTLNPKSMANSLTSFRGLQEKHTALQQASDEDVMSGTVKAERLDDLTREFQEVSCLHISVNGHEPEVLLGGLETARRADIIRISAPYDRDGNPVRDLVIQHLKSAGVPVFGISGAAVIAGHELGEYHAAPLNGTGVNGGTLKLAFFHLKRMVNSGFRRNVSGP